MAIDRIANYNRVIDITLLNKNNGTKLEMKCPRAGRKPDIEIEGTMSPDACVNNLTLRIKNFYDAYKIQADVTDIQVSAGYADSARVCFEGSVTTVYTETPGPDRVTVIQCVTAAANYQDKVINLSLNKGWKLIDAVNQLEKSLGFKKSRVAKDVENLTVQAGWDYTGRTQDALFKLGSYFPAVAFSISDNRILANLPGQTHTAIFTLPFLSAAPTISGTAVNVMAPWNPAIKPFDLVKFNGRFFAQDIRTDIRTDKEMKMLVSQIAFQFSTTSGNNSMELTGTLEGATQ